MSVLIQIKSSRLSTEKVIAVNDIAGLFEKDTTGRGLDTIIRELALQTNVLPEDLLTYTLAILFYETAWATSEQFKKTNQGGVVVFEKSLDTLTTSENPWLRSFDVAATLSGSDIPSDYRAYLSPGQVNIDSSWFTGNWYKNPKGKQFYPELQKKELGILFKALYLLTVREQGYKAPKRSEQQRAVNDFMKNILEGSSPGFRPLGLRRDMSSDYRRMTEILIRNMAFYNGSTSYEKAMNYITQVHRVANMFAVVYQ
jgi:hypothetical protein